MIFFSMNEWMNEVQAYLAISNELINLAWNVEVESKLKDRMVDPRKALGNSAIPALTIIGCTEFFNNNNNNNNIFAGELKKVLRKTLNT